MIDQQRANFASGWYDCMRISLSLDGSKFVFFAIQWLP